MGYITYILISEVANKTYVGYTDNLERRLTEHNNGESLFSKRYKPWKILYSENFSTKFEAIKKEKYFKSKAGRIWMKKNLFSS
jgi:putative endonuclease